MGRTKFKFGFALPQGWRWLDDETNGSPMKQYEFARNIATLADHLAGYDSVYAYDHFMPYFKPNIYQSYFECYVFLSAIAAVTRRIRIGQMVTCASYRNPALLAKMASTLDVVSNGRLDFGIGAGWYKEEYLSYGYDYLSNIIRIRELDESLSIIKAMWTEKQATFQGRYHSVKDAICSPKPIQRPYPTITVGGSGEKFLLRVVAKHADRYNHPYGSMAEVRRRISLLKEHCDTIGRNHKEIELSVVLRCLIKETVEDIERQITVWKNKNETVEQFKNRLGTETLIGTPEQIVSKLREYIDMGIHHFVFHFIGLKGDTIKLFNSKVISRI